jgi:hypothetical protein
MEKASLPCEVGELRLRIIAIERELNLNSDSIIMHGTDIESNSKDIAKQRQVFDSLCNVVGLTLLCITLNEVGMWLQR